MRLLSPPAYRLPCVLVALVCLACAPTPRSQRYPAGAPWDQVAARTVRVRDQSYRVSCIGRGAPLVVFEGGPGSPASAWRQVGPGVAAFTRACAYEQPVAADTLHALLLAAGERGPYVLVAHSLGASVARLFTSRFPGEVRGLVLLDPVVGDSSEPSSPFESPLIVLSSHEDQRAVHAALAEQSPRGQFVAVDSSSHLIQRDHPGAVVDAIRVVVEAARR